MKLWDDIKGIFGGKPQPPQEAAAPSAAPAPREDPATANEREKRIDDLNEQVAKQDADRDAPGDSGRFTS